MKRFHQFSIYSLSVLLIAITTGCATDYGCKGMPDEPSCLSTTQAYQVTNTALPEAPPEKAPHSRMAGGIAIMRAARAAARMLFFIGPDCKRIKCLIYIGWS